MATQIDVIALLELWQNCGQQVAIWVIILMKVMNDGRSLSPATR